MSATNCEFKFIKNEDATSWSQCTGTITLGCLNITVYPSMVTINDDDIPDIQSNLMSIINGNNGTVIFNDIDGENSVTVKDDIFIMHWGAAFDVISSTEFKCSYSSNKEEINKFLTYLHDGFGIYTEKDYMKTISMEQVKEVINAN